MEDELLSQMDNEQQQPFQGFSLREIVRAQEEAFRLEAVESVPRHRRRKRPAKQAVEPPEREETA